MRGCVNKALILAALALAMLLTAAVPTATTDCPASASAGALLRLRGGGGGEAKAGHAKFGWRAKKSKGRYACRHAPRPDSKHGCLLWCVFSFEMSGAVTPWQRLAGAAGTAHGHA